ncbi:DNA repair protein RecO [Aquabacter spiritensis]|uniref:DNA repair protein RecO n=1 Tax=Aquabacter spiritensis TaxID=933073 RepID=A0A4R3LRZ6_9HYPH|nr:DNA repair protein RecO [Aquabacter spiritensis]TCT02399.1 DNA replication and repair protein RecO [Aquabacter spiritensis]
MEWTDEGIVTGVRRHGEGSAIVELLTRERGRHAGLVRGGLSRRLAPLLQPGNRLHIVWRARIDTQLGQYTVEPVRLRADALMRTRHAAYGISHITSLVRLLAERDPHPGLFGVLDAVLDAFDAPGDAAILLARFEMAMLTELGIGLDLTRCAATGSREDLIYVSPRTGRAVSAGAGAALADRLLPLPSFLIASQVRPTPAELAAAFRLTGYFLSRRILEPRGLALSDARAAFIAAMADDQLNPKVKPGRGGGA